METRRVIGIGLIVMGVLLVVTLVVQTLLWGMPQAWTVAASGAIMGAAMAWPLTRPPPQNGPTCSDCGHVSWLSPEFGFCVHCGSKRVWAEVEPA